jgi:hypothetical protein
MPTNVQIIQLAREFYIAMHTVEGTPAELRANGAEFDELPPARRISFENGVRRVIEVYKVLERQ